jgi:hypothetical protein
LHQASLAVPQTTEWQRLENEIKAALIAARSNFVNVVVSWSSRQASGSLRRLDDM